MCVACVKSRPRRPDDHAPRRVTLKLLPFLVVATAWTQVPATFELPAPTGKLPVGTTQWVFVDPSRQETFAPGRPREVQVIAWYPAATHNGTMAPYMRNGMEEALSFARLAKLG